MSIIWKREGDVERVLYGKGGVLNEYCSEDCRVEGSRTKLLALHSLVILNGLP